MRLPSSLTTSPPPWLRVPMKLHDEKMGQVQDDQSRTSDEEENRSTTTSHRLICNNNANASQFDDALVRSERMGMKHARLHFWGEMINDESSILMDSTMPAMNNHTSIVNNNSQTQINADSGNNEAPTIEDKRRISKNMSVAQNESMESRHQQNENAEKPADFPSSCSQINSSIFLRKVKRRTLWWSNRGSGYANFYATMCILFWMLAYLNSGVKLTEAITTNGNTGDKLSTGFRSHKISERSAAIVKLEPDYHPINFPKKESHLEDNHLHSQQQSFNDRQSNSQGSLDNASQAEAFGEIKDGDKSQEEFNLNPEASRSTIIYQGIRNRTRVEVGPVNLFATKRRRIPDDGESGNDSSQQPGSNRKGRIMFPKSEALSEREDNSTLSGSTRNKKSEALLAATLSQSSEEGSSRKASPDVQDIIDGIVKLLGGKVHHPQPPGAAGIVPQVPFSQRQPQSTAYNLFNPNKPIYQTAKPSRINSRGPPLSAGTPNAATTTQQQQQQQPTHQSSFEAIPLEALNSEFKLNQTRFGPPFPLSQVVVAPEAPYKQGVPLPEQLVPPPSQNGNNHIHNNGNFNLRQPLPPPTAPVPYVTTGSNVNNLNGNNDNRPNNGFYANGNNRYVNGNAPTQQRPSSVPAYSSSLPTTASNHNGNTGLTTVSTSLTTSTNNGHHYHQHQTDNFNENGTRNPYSTTSHLNHHDGSGNTRKPTTTVSFDEGSDTGNTALTTMPSHGHVDKNRALSSPRPPPLSLTLPTGPEDDEEDDLRFTTNVDFDLGAGQNGVKWNESPAPDRLGNKKPTAGTQVHLEPTISEDSQVPSWSSDSGRVGSSKETVFEFSELGSNSAAPSVPNDPGSFIRPTSANTLYPTLVLETNSENGLVEIVTKLAAPPGGAIEHPQQVVPVSPTSTHQQLSTDITYVSTPANHQTPHPDSNLRKQVQHFNTLLQTTKQTPAGEGEPGFSTHSIHALPTPPLRPGIVMDDGPHTGNDGKGYGSVEVVTVEEAGGDGKVGEIFDVTVTAKQSFGGKVTGQPFHVSDPNKDDIVITQPTGTEQFVSIDGKRTYFNLHPNTPTPIGSGGATKAVGHVLPVENTDVVSVEVAKHPGSVKNSPSSTTASKTSQNIGVGTVGNPVPLLPQPPGKTLFGIGSGSGSAPSRAVSTSLSISGSAGMSITGPSGSSGGKTLPNLIRRPHTRRPSVPPVRIDTCIVGDDTTCNAEQGEVCRTESGVSSCVCRSGYARRRHREPCKAIVSLVLSIKLDKLGDKKLTYNPDYFNPNSELYQTLEWETIHAMDSAMGETTLSTGYVGSKLEAIGFDGRHAVVNTTVLIQENPKQAASQVKRDLQKQMIQVLTRNRNNFGKSQLWVEGPISAVSAITDLDECESPETNDCDAKARCVNTLGSFECRCEPGYGDQFERDKRRSGRKCETCNGKTYCNGRGECLIENGQKVCKCAGNYYGSQCDIDGEVLAVAIGASVSAVVIIGLTLACLCMWSRKWKREEQKAALMSRTLFGGMATQALSYLGKNNTNNPYQQHLSMDDRLRWAQCNEASMGGNIYVQNEPMSMHTSPQLIGTSMMETPPLMSARRSAETVDTTVDDLFDDRQTKQRPRSRASQMQGSLYYDLEPEPKSDIYASRSMVQFPAQFCVPMGHMSHYAPPNRGYFP